MRSATLSHLVAELYRRGVSYWPAPDGRLHLEAPAGALTEALRTAIREHREDLLFLCDGTPITGRGREDAGMEVGAELNTVAVVSATPSRDDMATDPRPELTRDTPRWRRLLAVAFLVDGDHPEGLFGALHGLRCLGARLVASGSTEQGCRLLPPEGYDTRQWQADRQCWLLPHEEILMPLLAGLARPDGAGLSQNRTRVSLLSEAP